MGLNDKSAAADSIAEGKEKKKKKKRNGLQGCFHAILIHI